MRPPTQRAGLAAVKEGVYTVAMERIATSRLLSEHGFRHGFSLRTGGASQPPFDSLNLGRGLGDDAGAVEANHRAFAATLGIGSGRLYEVSQVHGVVVREVDGREDPLLVRREEADALVALPAQQFAVGVRVADCLPLLIADRESGAVAAIHAGWRGVVAGIVPRALHVLRERAVGDVGSLVAAIGPHIRVGAFEVGAEVAEQIQRAVPSVRVVDHALARPHVNLALAVRSQLAQAGLAAEQVDDIGGCTYSDPARFFSHRRDAGRTGRHLAGIVAEPRQ